ncbi:hypothetical protein PSI9734_00629 [Pseudidiomarina piscicola]|uniref:DUF1499 domain-containing protein n=1 Tax=Pseudidiomarina piscicola TaxID=2614830 RepID=A0A6S6WMW8_9GAMM|nr:DUF1499 domain-containing protein [Pseudidiomarina piscicola]CAB0150061.1 hypothetical protein PSI9734_00629 [Pseudidiomarina piscicola]VZT39503.1 hypothetical protein PSI9734_00629 [Pseudomonas aeruginosa]
MSKKIGSALILLGFLAAFLLLIAGPLYRWQLLELGVAFTLLRWAAYVGVAAVVFIIVYLIWKRPRGARLAMLTLAAVAAFVSFYLPYQQLQTARSVPPIHDISTDLEQPPKFDAIAPLRADAPNPVAYPGEETAKQQREAYPDLAPMYVQQNQAQVFDAAMTVVKSMGWQLVASDREAGRIEATASTFWFGFKDDVVIRLRTENAQTRVDIRSKSRVGRSDVGKNAARIERFQQQLQGQL